MKFDKVENFLKGSLDSIPSPSPSVKMWVGSKIGHFCLQAVHRKYVGGLDNPPKHAFVIFEWSLIE